MILPISTSAGWAGMDSRFSIVPRSRSRVMPRPVIMIIVIVRTTPIRPGTMLYWVIPSGLYSVVDAQVDGVLARGPDKRAGPGDRAAARVFSSRREAADGVADGGGIGPVGFDQKRGPVAPQEIAREVLRNADDELDLAPQRWRAGLRLAYPTRVRR